MKIYNYEMRGTATNDQTWRTSGTLTDRVNDLSAVFDMMIRDSFAQLTNGRAVFGKPGVGCSGPYQINRIVIERIESEEN